MRLLHISDKRMGVPEPFTITVNNTGDLSCQECKYSHPNVDAVFEHVSYFHVQQTSTNAFIEYRCEICTRKVFDDFNNFKAHLKCKKHKQLFCSEDQQLKNITNGKNYSSSKNYKATKQKGDYVIKTTGLKINIKRIHSLKRKKQTRLTKLKTGFFSTGLKTKQFGEKRKAGSNKKSDYTFKGKDHSETNGEKLVRTFVQSPTENIPAQSDCHKNRETTDSIFNIKDRQESETSVLESHRSSNNSPKDKNNAVESQGSEFHFEEQTLDKANENFYRKNDKTDKIVPMNWDTTDKYTNTSGPPESIWSKLHKIQNPKKNNQIVIKRDPSNCSIFSDSKDIIKRDKFHKKTYETLSFKCSVCRGGRQYPSMDKLLAHAKVYHSRPTRKRKIIPFRCSCCFEVFLDLQAGLAHKRLCRGEKFNPINIS